MSAVKPEIAPRSRPGHGVGAGPGNVRRIGDAHRAVRADLIDPVAAGEPGPLPRRRIVHPEVAVISLVGRRIRPPSEQPQPAREIGPGRRAFPRPRDVERTGDALFAADLPWLATLLPDTQAQASLTASRILTVELADLDGSATEVAVTVTRGGAGRPAGAV